MRGFTAPLDGLDSPKAIPSWMTVPTTRDPRTHAIIGAAMEVHSYLGPGFLEAVYHDALDVELQLRGIPAAREVSLPVHYKGIPLGAPYRADFLCYDEVIVEIKAKRDLAEADRNQVVHYLKGSGKSTGLLLNFGEPRLDFQRFAFWHQATASEASGPSETPAPPG